MRRRELKLRENTTDMVIMIKHLRVWFGLFPTISDRTRFAVTRKGQNRSVSSQLKLSEYATDIKVIMNQVN